MNKRNKRNKRQGKTDGQENVKELRAECYDNAVKMLSLN